MRSCNRSSTKCTKLSRIRFRQIKLPPPESRDFPSGTVYYYRLPKNLGLDKHLAPCAAVANDTLSISLLPRQAARMLEPTDLQAGTPLADPNRNMGAAVYFNFARSHRRSGAVGRLRHENWVLPKRMRTGLSTVMDQVNAGLDSFEMLQGRLRGDLRRK